MRIGGMGYAVGPPKIALGKFTATSTISSKKQSYEGLTVHSATNNGILYEARTYQTKTY